MKDNTLIRQAYNAVMANINNKEEDTVAMVKNSCKFIRY